MVKRLVQVWAAKSVVVHQRVFVSSWVCGEPSGGFSGTSDVGGFRQVAQSPDERILYVAPENFHADRVSERLSPG